MILLIVDHRVETDLLLIQTCLDDFFHALEGSAADEKDICGIDLEKLLMRVLSSTLGRHGSYGSLKDLKKCLLYALTGHIAGDGGVLGFSRDLIKLVDVNNTVLGTLDIVVSCLNQLQEDIFHILTHITGLSQRGGICDGKGHIQHFRQCLSQQGFT